MNNNSQIKLYEEVKERADLNFIQGYLKKVMELRGFEGQKPQEKMLLLTEEVGELAKAIRKSDTKIAIDFDRIQHYDTVESELADVFIVLISLCNLLEVNLYKAFLEKEKANVARKWEKTE